MSLVLGGLGMANDRMVDVGIDASYAGQVSIGYVISLFVGLR